MSSSHTFNTNIFCSFRPKRPNLSTAKPHTIPARDKVIDFGKYKGKMLGALPSIYLKWVSKNLRAGDFEHWAILADQVLEDQIYQDRVEWEFADSVLNGDRNYGSLPMTRDEGAVSQLLEIGERFGWDIENKVGWSKVKFELLGTSRGGRIPRKVSSWSTNSGFKQLKDLNLKKEEKDNIVSQSEMRRKKRRERGKLKKEQEVADMKRENLGILTKSKDKVVNAMMDSSSGTDDEYVVVNNPFPGRDSLLFKTVINAKRFLIIIYQDASKRACQ